MAISNQELKTILKDIISETEELAYNYMESESDFLEVLLCIYRSSFFTINDINLLSEGNMTGASILCLSRKISENAITIEYIIAKGKEEESKMFKKHIWVQAKKERDFLEFIGGDINNLNVDVEKGNKILNKEYDKLSKKEKERRTWSANSIDMMLEFLHEEKKICEFDFTRLSQAYVWGSRLTHPNPFVASAYLKEKDIESNNNYWYTQGLFMAIVLYIRLTTRCIDEINTHVEGNPYENLSKKIIEIYNRLESM